MELSKNIVRGFAAYDRLLESRPDLRGRVVFLACCYPSRLGVPAYAAYRDEVVAAASGVNDRWGDAWTGRPIELLTDDDYPRSVAALRRYDVLMVNPVRDGLNLVAKEGPMVNERDGQLVLSIEAGAWAELGRPRRRDLTVRHPPDRGRPGPRPRPTGGRASRSGPRVA